MDSRSSQVMVCLSTVLVACDLIVLGLDLNLDSDDEDLLEELGLIADGPGLSSSS